MIGWAGLGRAQGDVGDSRPVCSPRLSRRRWRAIDGLGPEGLLYLVQRLPDVAQAAYVTVVDTLLGGRLRVLVYRGL